MKTCRRKPFLGAICVLAVLAAALLCGVRTPERMMLVLVGMALAAFGVIVILRKRMHAEDGF